MNGFERTLRAIDFQPTDRPPVVVGSVSIVTTMPFGTPDDVRADVRRCKKLAAAKGGGWLMNFSSPLSSADL